MKLLLAIIPLLLLLGALLWALLPPSSAPATVPAMPVVGDSPPTGQVAGDSESPEPSERQALGSPGEPLADQQTETPGNQEEEASPAHVHASQRLPTRLPVDDEYFEGIYRGSTLDDLRIARDDILRQFKEKSQMAFSERHEAGLYDVQAPGVPLIQRPEEPLAQMRSSRDHPDENHVVRLPFHEYPQIYLLKDEWSWLMRRLSSFEGGAGGENN